MLKDIKCEKCGYTEEIMIKSLKNFDENQYCPECNDFTNFKILISKPSVHFKGSGFYSTDYKKV